MKLGIRAKLVGALVLAGLAPLTLALAGVLISATRTRTHLVGRTFRDIAAQQAQLLTVALTDQLDVIQQINALPETAEFLEQANRVAPSTAQELRHLDQLWAGLKPDSSDAAYRQVMDNQIARQWQSVQRQQPRFAEILITDLTGRLIAASNLTTDYYQADEVWWQNGYNGGRGRLYMQDVSYDESAISGAAPGVIVATFVIPLYVDSAGGDHKLAGMMKASLDAGWIIQQLRPTEAAREEIHLEHWLIHRDGRPIHQSLGKPQLDALPAPLLSRIRERSHGYMVDCPMAGHEVLGYSSVTLPLGADGKPLGWHVVVTAAKAEALRPVHDLAMMVGIAGASLIIASFAGGLLLIRRHVIRPIRTLRDAAGRLERGNLKYRLLPPDDKLSDFHDDELGDLAKDFNLMADTLKRDLEAMRQADILKQRFIDLASHELRTPVTYILGVTELSQRQKSADLTIIAKIAAKAQRLSHIVENMFKLLASGAYDSTLRLSPLEIKPLVLATVREIQPFLNDRQQSLDVDVADDLPRLEADAEKVKDILLNLLDNAIRFSPNGAKLGLSAAIEGDRVRITLSDNGPGIPAEELQHLFEAFYGTEEEVRHHSSGEHEHLSRGARLGLSVVKRFVDMHGGEVKVQTGPTGTVFIVMLPLAGPKLQ